MYYSNKIIIRASLFILLFLLLFLHNSWAQALNIKFNLITGKDGISLGKVNGITQDPNGYMWFADQTQRCITRYDGYSMLSFRNDPQNENSLGGTYPEWIISDPSGIIWIGFTGTGLDRFDPKTGSFKHFRHWPNDPASLSNDTVNAILMDHLGNLWVGSYGGLDLLDNKTGQFKHYRYNASDPHSLSNNRIRALYEDRQGTLWIGAGSAFETETPNDGGLNRFNRETATFTRYLNDPKNPNTLINNKVRAIFEDSRGTFWVGTCGDGLHTMDRATGLFKRHTYNSAHPEQLSRPPVKDIYDHITFITEDGTGAIWIGTFEAGLTRYDPTTKTAVRFNSSTSKSSRFIDNSGWAAYTSRDNVLWVSTEPQNLYRMDPFHISIPHIASTGAVNSFFQEQDGVLWIGTDAGLIRDDRNKKNTKRFMHDTRNPGSISNNKITSICKDNKGNLWIGTNGGGLNKFDTEKHTFIHYRHKYNTIYKTYADREGSLWISTEMGLDQLNIVTGVFTHYQNNPKDTNSLSSDLVTDIFQDRQKRLWAATFFSGGLNVMDPNTHHFTHYLKGLDVNSVYQDSDGVIWTGTIEGLYKFDSSSGTFLRFTDSENGVRFKNVTSIIEDDAKNLWIGTSDDIERLNPKRNKLTIYGKNHGVEHSLNFMAVYKGLNNELFFGGTNGYYNFFPQQLTTNNKPPEIVISDFQLGDNSVMQEQNNSLYQRLIKTKEIVLRYNHNSFSFDFAAIDYRSPEENRHLFLLENYDNSWQQGNERTTAYYFNVPPGRYTFRVRAANSNGIWAEKAIAVIINPPWWRTWWAYIIYVLVLAGSIIAIVRYRLRSLRHEVEEHKRERQFAELQKQKTELEMQAQTAQIKAIVATQEEERKRISRDLHDDIGTKLSALNLYLSSLNEKATVINNDEIKSLARSSKQFIKEAMYDVRQLLVNLSPAVLEEFGYTMAVEGLVNKINEAHMIHFDLEEFGIKQRFEKDYELALYRITQELINNVLKHARAKRVFLQIGQQDEKIILKIEDDGIGFDVNAHKDGYGLKNLAARTKLMHGIMTIDSQPGKGTTALIEIPYILRGCDPNSINYESTLKTKEQF